MWHFIETIKEKSQKRKKTIVTLNKIFSVERTNAQIFGTKSPGIPNEKFTSDERYESFSLNENTPYPD